jgi:hypothetical protein
MYRFSLYLFIFAGIISAEISSGYYVDVSDELMTSPVSAAKVGSDLSIGNGASVESTPANLTFDSLNHLSLSYAGYYGNVFSSSMLSYIGHPSPKTGISVLLGYIYIPDIQDTRASTVDDSGRLAEARISYFSASKILFRAGFGRIFYDSDRFTVSAGIAANAKRVRLPETGYGVSLDGGLKGYMKTTGFSTGLQVENLTSSYTYWSKNFQERAHPHVRVGFGWETNIPYLYGSLKMSYASIDLLANEGINSISYDLNEIDNPIETIEHTSISDDPTLIFTHGKYGLEFTILNRVALRGGFTRDRYSFGAGVQVMENKAGFDLAYISHALAGTYQLAMHYTW